MSINDMSYWDKSSNQVIFLIFLQDIHYNDIENLLRKLGLWMLSAHVKLQCKCSGLSGHDQVDKVDIRQISKPVFMLHLPIQVDQLVNLAISFWNKCVLDFFDAQSVSLTLAKAYPNAEIHT